MTIKKPYRICNQPTQGMRLLEMSPPDCTPVFLKEKEEQYELRINLLDNKNQNHTISICDGILYLRSNTDKQTLITRFSMPANVRQEKIQAFYRPYGVKVLMPKVLSDGIVIIIPIN